MKYHASAGPNERGPHAVGPGSSDHHDLGRRSPERVSRIRKHGPGGEDRPGGGGGDRDQELVTWLPPPGVAALAGFLVPLQQFPDSGQVSKTFTLGPDQPNLQALIPVVKR